MKFKSLTRILAWAMVVTIISATSLFAFGFESATTQDNTNAGTNSTVPIVATAELPTFKAVVPLSLPVTIDASGNVTTATNAKITNQSSYGKILVTGVNVTPAAGWTINEFTDKATYGILHVNSKVFGMTINNCKAAATTGAMTTDATNFPAINIGAENALNVTYAALFAPQSNGLTDIQVGSAVFTIGWDSI